MPEEEKLRLPKSLLGGFDEICPNLGRRMHYNRIVVRRCVVVHPRVKKRGIWGVSGGFEI